MNALTDLINRLKARTDSEHEQALVRIFIAMLVIAGMGVSQLNGTLTPDSLLLMRGMVAFLVFSVGLFISICIFPAPNVARRFIGMLADAATTTFAVYLSGDAGLAIFGVYLFITFGYGFRYGRIYLFACQALCIAGYDLLLLDPAYRYAHRGAWWGLALALFVLPLYVSTLLKRIEDAKARADVACARAEQALKECLEREQRAA